MNYVWFRQESVRRWTDRRMDTTQCITSRFQVDNSLIFFLKYSVFLQHNFASSGHCNLKGMADKEEGKVPCKNFTGATTQPVTVLPPEDNSQEQVKQEA